MVKKILIFSLAYYPRFVGGAEIAVKEITDRISPDDIEFHMVTLQFDSMLPKVEKVGNVLVHRIGFSRLNPTTTDLQKFPLFLNKPLFQFLAAINALFLYKKYHYDAVWAMMVHSSGVPATIFKLFHPRIPYILTLQEGDPIEQIERTMRPLWPLFSHAFTSADIVQVISTFLGRWARQRGFEGPLEIIPNAVDTKLFSTHTTEHEFEELQKKLGKEIGNIFLITTSRLVHKNAIDDCLYALALLPKNIHFLILGIGTDETTLKKLSHELGVNERVQFLGQVAYQDIPKYLHVSDIFIRPSRSEGMGNSFIEAFAASIPVIATQEGGIADFLFDAVRNPNKQTTGFAVDKNAPKQIAEAVQNILANPEQTKEVTENARTLAFKKYDWSLVAHDMQKRVFDVALHLQNKAQ